MMKRITLVAALIVAASMMAENSINWFSAIDNHAEFGSSSVTSVLDYSDSSVLIAGNFATCTEEPDEATFLGQSIVGAPFTPNMSQTNKNILLTKVRPDGTVVWMLHSDRGNGEAIAIPTADGGALAFATMTYTQKNALGDDYVLRLKHGDQELCSAKRPSDGENSIQYGLLLRISAEGEASITAEVSNTGEEKNGFGAISWATDGSHYYLLLNDTTVITVNEQAITPEAGGSMVVLSFDQFGQYERALISKNQPVSSRSGQLFCRGNQLYALSVVATDEMANNIYLYRWALGADDEQCMIIPGAVVKNKNVIQPKALYVDADNRFAYIVGGLNGGLVIGDQTLKQASGKLVPFIVKYDLKEHKAVKGYFHESTGIGGASAIFSRKDSLYVHEYDWGSTSGNRIRLEVFDTNLEPQEEIGLLNTKAQEVSKDAVIVNGNVVFNINTGKGATLSFVADPNITLTTPAISGFVASVQLFEPDPESAVESATLPATCTKQLCDGQILIIRDGHSYNALGAQVK